MIQGFFDGLVVAAAFIASAIIVGMWFAIVFSAFDALSSML